MLFTVLRSILLEKQNSSVKNVHRCKVFCLSIYTLFFLAGFAGFQGPASKDANKSKSLEIQAWRFKLSFVPVDIKQLPPLPTPLLP